MTNATEITNRMRSLLRCEQGAMADFLVALAEVIDQKLWRELGYSSPFYYVRREFKLCAGAAQNRITAAELILWAPEIEAALRSGQLYLSTVTVLAKVLTSENKDEVLPRFFDLSRREAEQVAVSIRPAEVIPVRDVVTPLRPAASTGRAVAPATTLPMAVTSDSPAADAAGSSALAFHMDETTPPVRVAAPVVQLVPEPPRDEIEPLDAKLSRLHITVDDELLQLLEASKDAFSHAFPSGRAADVIKHGLRVALAQHDKRLGLVEKPRKTPRPSRTDNLVRGSRATASPQAPISSRARAACLSPVPTTRTILASGASSTCESTISSRSAGSAPGTRSAHSTTIAPSPPTRSKKPVAYSSSSSPMR
jgi:hypothetical protein